jgi:hypothetical protein
MTTGIFALQIKGAHPRHGRTGGAGPHCGLHEIVALPFVAEETDFTMSKSGWAAIAMIIVYAEETLAPGRTLFEVVDGGNDLLDAGSVFLAADAQQRVNDTTTYRRLI